MGEKSTLDQFARWKLLMMISSIRLPALCGADARISPARLMAAWASARCRRGRGDPPRGSLGVGCQNFSGAIDGGLGIGSLRLGLGCLDRVAQGADVGRHAVENGFGTGG